MLLRSWSICASGSLAQSSDGSKGCKRNFLGTRLRASPRLRKGQDMTRTCITCGKKKDEESFYQRFNRPSRMAECKACFNERTNELRRKRVAAAKEKKE